MRSAAILIAICLVASCKGGGKSEPDPAALKAQQDLMARRDELLAQREQIQKDSDAIDVEIKKVEAAGGDTSELTKKKTDLQQKLKGQEVELDKVKSTVEINLAKISQSGGGDSSGALAMREASMGSREKTVAAREEKVASRETALAAREAAFALREKETCGGGGTTTIIKEVNVPQKPGGNYSRKEVESVLGRAKSTMQRKGLTTADLPPAAQSLERDSLSAINSNDMGKAYFAAAQLAANVDAVKVDGPFVKAKYNRLAARVAAAKVSDAVQKKLTDGMTVILEKWHKGDFVGANATLNNLASQI